MATKSSPKLTIEILLLLFKGPMIQLKRRDETKKKLIAFNSLP